MRIAKGNRPLVVGLYLNAAVMLAILFTLLGRSSISFSPSAYGVPAPQAPPIAGGGSIYLMPGQLSEHQWGCYIMDIDAQTLCTYAFYPGEKQLRLVAARNFHFDRKLGNYNTMPPWTDIENLAKLEAQGIRANGDKQPDHQPEGPNNNQ
jgi:hypothetical protein